MAEFFDFYLYFIRVIVEFLFSIDLGIGFTFGDAMIGITILSVLITALVVRYNSERISLSGDAKIDRRMRIQKAKRISKKGG